MAGIVDGNPVNATYTNSKLASKDGDNTFVGMQTLNRAGSGGTITDLQQTVNNLLSAGGIPLAEKGAANGVATLDATGRIPSAQLTVEVMEYKGVWNASTNSPSLADGAGSTGDTYRVGTAGTQNLGSGSVTYALGDYVIYNGTIWEKADTTDSVNSVNGQTGAVSLDLDDLTDVVITAPANRDIIKHNGTEFVNTQLYNSANDNATGANATLSAVTTTVVRLTNASLVSVDMIPAGYSAQPVVIENKTTVSILINNETGGTAANRILTGTGSNLTVEINASIILIYDTTSSRWHVVGGSGGGGANRFLSNLDTPVAFNQHLVPDGDGTRNVGSDTNHINQVHANDISNNANTVFDLTSKVMYDGTPQVSIDFNNRTLNDPSGVPAVDWSGADLDVIARKIINVNDPTAAQDAATKNYVDKYVVRTTTTTDTATTDDYLVLCDATAASYTQSFYTAVGNDGRRIRFKKIDGGFNKVTLSATGLTSNKLMTPGEEVEYVARGGVWVQLNRYTDTKWASVAVSSSWVTNTTVTCRWRRRGDGIDIQYAVNTTGAPTATPLTVDIPNAAGWAINATNLLRDSSGGNRNLGDAHILDSGTAVYWGSVGYSTTAALNFWSMDDAGAAVTGNQVTQASPMTWANGDTIVGRIFGLPIDDFEA